MSCPYVVTSDEGTSYCQLAERGIPYTTALLRQARNALRGADLHFKGISPDRDTQSRESVEATMDVIAEKVDKSLKAIEVYLQENI